MRNTAVVTLLISLSASGVSFGAKHNHEDDHRHEGSRGGGVVEMSDVDHELVATVIVVFDSMGKPARKIQFTVK